MKTYFKLKRGILYSKTWINHQCFTCMFVTKQGLEYTGTVEWYQFIKDYTLLRRYINWMTVKLKTTEIGADIENCDVCPYVWNVHFLVWWRFKVKCLISIIFTTSCVEMNTGTLFSFEWMKYVCESSHSLLLFPKHLLFPSPIHDMKLSQRRSRQMAEDKHYLCQESSAQLQNWWANFMESNMPCL